MVIDDDTPEELLIDDSEEDDIAVLELGVDQLKEAVIM